VEVTQEKLRELGPIHHGRKRIQPSRQELSQFFRKAEPLLKFERIWFDHVDPEHEVWTRAPYTVFCYTPEDIEDRIEYIKGNPLKEGLSPQAWPFGGVPALPRTVRRTFAQSGGDRGRARTAQRTLSGGRPAYVEASNRLFGPARKRRSVHQAAGST